MFQSVKATARAWSDVQRFRNAEDAPRRIVLYTEGTGHHVYLAPILSELRRCCPLPLCWVTSAIDDPILRGDLEDVETFYVGSGFVRTLFFQSLQARALVMTMPDLDSFYIKRSPHKVNYVYVHHSMVSTHMVYRREAFDAFDTILAVGPHHVLETRRREEIALSQNLQSYRRKTTIEAGYAPLDSIVSMIGDVERYEEHCPAQGSELDAGDPSNRISVLLAPSWGEQCILETQGEELVRVLLSAGFEVIVRPHPRTLKRSHAKITRMKRRLAKTPGLAWDLQANGQDSLLRSDIMISDWSGAALEFAFGTERPVLFVDVPRKVNNPDYLEMDLVPLEVSIRDQIGSTVTQDKLASIPETLRQLLRESHRYRSQIQELRREWVFNVGSSASVAAKAIVEAAGSIDSESESAS
jgi:hypothetical protein